MTYDMLSWHAQKPCISWLKHMHSAPKVASSDAIQFAGDLQLRRKSSCVPLLTTKAVAGDCPRNIISQLMVSDKKRLTLDLSTALTVRALMIKGVSRANIAKTGLSLKSMSWDNLEGDPEGPSRALMTPEDYYFRRDILDQDCEQVDDGDCWGVNYTGPTERIKQNIEATLHSWAGTITEPNQGASTKPTPERERFSVPRVEKDSGNQLRVVPLKFEQRKSKDIIIFVQPLNTLPRTRVRGPLPSFVCVRGALLANAHWKGPSSERVMKVVLRMHDKINTRPRTKKVQPQRPICGIGNTRWAFL